ncbi:hypothetical protein DFJ73DRAFT_841758 [Zopfochytrium polystomum]|nr:hypothetical protein DFJ73DRAFT_841758 [Zopfochytrium polystomum]
MNATFTDLTRHFRSAASGATLNFYAYSSSSCTDSSLDLLAHFVGQPTCSNYPCTRQNYGPYVSTDCADGNFDSIAAQRFGSSSYVAVAGYDTSCTLAGSFYIRADGGCYTSGNKDTDSGFVATINGNLATVKVYTNPTCSGDPKVSIDSTTPLDCKGTGLVISAASNKGSPLPTGSAAAPTGTGSSASPSSTATKSGASPKVNSAVLIVLVGAAAGLIASLAA